MNRVAIPGELSSHIDPLYRCVRAGGWPLLMVQGVEAGDVIGSLTCVAREAGITQRLQRNGRGEEKHSDRRKPGVACVQPHLKSRLEKMNVATNSRAAT